jgi:hypothetical protein
MHTGHRLITNLSTMVPPLPKFCAGNAANHSTNPRQGIILKFVKQPFAPDFGLQHDLRTGAGSIAPNSSIMRKSIIVTINYNYAITSCSTCGRLLRIFGI